ncbi:MAG: colanic acid biosynthesis glycosyltransferase WcaL [Verrucomicrobiaceae bacterium]|nr:colanic acid biosynthesis glycosyltransferase WcaL [Verrucomicrobiaceae bacterium]
MSTVASYCTTFLKPEMMHIYRQVTGLKDFQTFAVCRERMNSCKFPFPEVEIVGSVKSNFIRRFWLKYIKNEPPIVYRGEYAALQGLLDRRQADLMHVYFGHTGVHLLPFIKRWPKPTVVSFHGMDIQPREGQSGYLESLRELLRTVPLAMGRSNSLKEGMIALGLPEERFRMNRTGIPLENFPFHDREVPRGGKWHIVQACRLIEKKGIDIALKAFAGFVSHYPDAKYTIAGEGPLLEPMKALADQLGLAGAVNFTGFLSEAELRDLYLRSHIFLHPSQMTADFNQEGIPNSMLEAMSTGLPVVATLHGGIPEAVDHGTTGLLTDERDVAGVQDAIMSLVSSPDVWLTMGRCASMAMHENFERSMQVAKLEDVYREAIELSHAK